MLVKTGEGQRGILIRTRIPQRPTTIMIRNRWVGMSARTARRFVSPIFVWTACLASAVAVDNLRLCRFIWLVFHGKLYKILRVALGYRPLRVCALAYRLSFLCFSREIVIKHEPTILGDTA